VVNRQELIISPDGRQRWLATTKLPLLDDLGQIVGLVGIGHDITERKRAEAERSLMEIHLRQAQKLESIGQLAAGIAHEINTPMQYIGDNTRFLQDAFEGLSGVVGAFRELADRLRQQPGMAEVLAPVDAVLQAADVDYLLAETPRAIEQSLEGADRVTKIVRAMKEFSHPGSEQKTDVDLNRAIESTITVARNEWKYVADLETDLDPELPSVPCLPGEFNQVLLNLIINAAHAIADVACESSVGKGRVTIRTRQAGEWAEIRVEDTGTGIPEAARGRIFDPFFTTKSVGEGSGQGLAIARSVVVDKHGGTLTFETEMGRGTTFIIRLPLTSGDTARAIPEA
jgi:signal transduction histidine kinase